MTKTEFDAKKNAVSKISELCDLQAIYIQSLESEANSEVRTVASAEGGIMQRGKTMKLSKIPIPRCYDNSPSFVADYSEDIVYFRERLPEFSEWSDEQIVAFGDDFARVMRNMCAMQPNAIDPKEMRDVGMALVILDTDMDQLGKYADEVDWYEENGTKGIWDILNNKSKKEAE